MDWLRLFRRSSADAQRAQEMQAHLDLQIDEYVADGLTPADARREALRRFGNPRALREEMDQANGFALLDALLRDARYACRMLRKAPAFSITAILTLGLAIAVNTAVFSIVDAVLLKPLPYPDPDRLALVTTTSSTQVAVRQDRAQHGLAWETIRDHATTVDRAVFSSWPTGVNVMAGGRASHVRQQRVGSGFFRVLGVRPLLGREFTPEEDRPGGPAAVILSHVLWQTIFNGDRTVVGRAISVRGEAATVVGVMPEGFTSGVTADLWTLRASTSGEGAEANYAILVRILDGISVAQSQADFRRLGEAIERQRPGPEGTSLSWGLEPLQQGMTSDLRNPLVLLWAAVGIVLLVACVNLAGLLLARGAGRAREIATRVALGSGRLAVIRQLLVESAVLGLLAAAAGLVLASLALEGLRALAHNAFEIWQPVAIDGRAGAVAVTLSMVASAFFGVVPALQATRIDLQSALIDGSARTVAGRANRWPTRILVVAQVALGVVLLVGAGLLLRTFAHLRGLDPGFDARGVTTVTVSLQDARYRTSEAVTQMFDGTLARLGERPGIESAAVALGLPYERLLNLGFRHLDGPQASAAAGRMTSATYVAGDLFSALRIPVRAGRTFDDRDRSGSPAVAVVSETFARLYFEGDSPVGRRIAIAGGIREIIGVVGDVQVRPGWGDNGPLAAMPLTYIPLSQASDGLLRLVHGWFAPAFVVRSSLPHEEAASALRSGLDAQDPLLPFARVRSMDEVQSVAYARERFLMALLAGLAGAAVLLAGIGIHGLIATQVTERTREMGIRLALGEPRSRAVRTLVLPGLLLALAGTTIGIVAAVGFARLLRTMIWGVAPNDPLTFSSVAVILLLAAAVASLVPALKILNLEPARALRQS